MCLCSVYVCVPLCLLYVFIMFSVCLVYCVFIPFDYMCIAMDVHAYLYVSVASAYDIFSVLLV